jgi:hypothetical protein
MPQHWYSCDLFIAFMHVHTSQHEDCRTVMGAKRQGAIIRTIIRGGKLWEGFMQH